MTLDVQGKRLATNQLHPTCPPFLTSQGSERIKEAIVAKRRKEGKMKEFLIILLIWIAGIFAIFKVSEYLIEKQLKRDIDFEINRQISEHVRTEILNDLGDSRSVGTPCIPVGNGTKAC